MNTPDFDLFKFSSDDGAATLRQAIAMLPQEQRHLAWEIARCAFTTGVVLGAKSIVDTVRACSIPRADGSALQ